MKFFFRKIVHWTVLLLFIPPLLSAGNVFPMKAYAPDSAWTGVLRIWTCADTPFGTGTSLPWLNARAAAFEKRNTGIRIQFTEISQEVLASFSVAPHPPDAIIFTPDVLPSAEGLVLLEPPDNLLHGLEETGLAHSHTKALPIAMGGYFWICSGFAPGSPQHPSDSIFIVPPDTPNSSYSAALLALFAEKIPADPKANDHTADLGLPDVSATPEPPTDYIPLRKPTSFSSDFRSASARSLFVSGDADAFIGTTQDIRRLEQLADSGTAPEYNIFAGATAFTDRLAMAAVVDHDDPDSLPRERLCADFITFLLTEESQSSLKTAYAFRVTEGEPLYSTSRNGMAEAEASAQGALIAPNAFDTAWRSRAVQATDLFLHTDAEAADLLRTIFPQ